MNYNFIEFLLQGFRLIGNLELGYKGLAQSGKTLKTLPVFDYEILAKLENKTNDNPSWNVF